MEPLMYDAIVRMKKEDKIDGITASVPNGKEISGKRMKPFTLDGNNLRWKAQHVPTQDQLEEAVGPVHRKGKRETLYVSANIRGCVSRKKLSYSAFCRWTATGL